MQRLPKRKTILAPPLFIEEVVQSTGGVYYHNIQKTPSRLRRTPSINRGRVELLTTFENSFNSQSKIIKSKIELRCFYAAQ